MLRIFFSVLFIFHISTFFFTPVLAQNPENYAPYGKVLTPKGDLKVLLIYAGFDGFDAQQQVGEWKASADLPPWKPEELFYSDNDGFEKDTSTHPFSISDFYYYSSGKKFKITSGVVPVRINIDPSSVTSFSQCNRMVMEKMKLLYPDFDWKPYDSRTNMPSYTFDNSISPPDHKPDYVIIAYRYAAGWAMQPKQGMQRWAVNFSRLDGLFGFNYNGYTFDGSGFTMANFDGRPDYFCNLFLHELAHELFSCPHYSGANGASGNYFHIPSMGWDMMNQTGGSTSSAFEKWMLGWTEITHDLKDVKDNGTYLLRDAETTGDCIRIKIPHSNQYLWIENRQLQSKLDHKPWRNLLKGEPPGTMGIPDKEPGVYMFIESVLNDRKNINSGMVFDLNKVNGIYPLHGAGNFDYRRPEQFTMRPEEYWNNKLYWFERGNANPISGLNPFINYRGDFNRNGVISNVPSSFGAYNGMSDTESFPIVKEILGGNPVLTYANTGGRNEDAVKYRRSDAFQKGDELSLAGNPVPINRPYYNWNKAQLDPYYFNGISIEIKDIKHGQALFKIRFNDVEIDKNTRWCGNMVLKPVPHSKGLAAHLHAGKILTIDQSAIPDRHLPPFCSSSIFVIDSGAVFVASTLSQIYLLEGSNLIVKKGGKLKLEKNATLKIDETSLLVLEEGGKIELGNGGKIEAPSPTNIRMAVPSAIDSPQNMSYDNPNE